MLVPCGSCGRPFRWYERDPAHEGQFAAVRDGLVVAHESNLPALVERIRQKGLDARAVVIEHVAPRPRLRVF